MEVINNCFQPGIICIEFTVDVPFENLKIKRKPRMILECTCNNSKREILQISSLSILVKYKLQTTLGFLLG